MSWWGGGEINPTPELFHESWQLQVKPYDLAVHHLPRALHLNNLNLYLIGIYQIVTGNSKSSTGNLLDGRSAGISIFIWSETINILSTFPSVGFTAKSVHCNCQTFVSFFGNGPVRHRTCFETLNNF